MEAKDLMIGDWVQHASGKYFRITRIDMRSDGSIHFACGHPHLWDYNNKFSPIPLTAEILEKIGFSKYEMPSGDYEYKCHSNLVQISRCKSQYCWYISIEHVILCLKIKYVHELQHALRLCGIEKEIVL